MVLYFFPDKHRVAAGMLMGLSVLNQYDDMFLVPKYLAKCLCIYKGTQSVFFPFMLFALFNMADHSLLAPSNTVAAIIDLYTNFNILRLLN